MTAAAIAIHGHVYQPPRADPRTGVVPVEPSAAPFHDWNSRITAECYRPNAFARIFDDSGRIVRIVNNYERMSFNVGPTLAHWLVTEAPDVLARMVDGDRVGRTAIAHPYHHAILPLAEPRDALTELRWGIADFEHRFGRRPIGTWLPETAIDDRVLAQLAEVGIGFTILAPHQVPGGLPAGRVAAWRSPTGTEVRLCVYDGPLSHDLAFGSAIRDTDALVSRMASLSDGGIVVAATDAETFGHHHRYTERGVAHALFIEADERGLPTGPLSDLLFGVEPISVPGVVTSAWSCAHGIGRWNADCGCASDGGHGFHQRWRAPLRQALNLLRDHANDVFGRRGAEVFHDPWAARDDYGGVLANPGAWGDFSDRHVRPLASDDVARALLESQEATLASFTSCAWFFADLARREVAIVLQEAALSAQRLTALDEAPPLDVALDILATAQSNDAELPTGREVWDWAMAGGELGTWTPADVDPLSGLLDELIVKAAAGDAAADCQATELIGVLQQTNRSDLDRVQNTIWTASGNVSPQLEAALGFAEGALSLR
jgi:alpha-amylase/alpha-mannosidase (GH57 family)